jgi:hypothetical protein
MHEKGQQLSLGLVLEFGKDIDEAVLCVEMLYVKRLSEDAIDLKAWDRVIDSHHQYSAKILGFKDALGRAIPARISLDSYLNVEMRTIFDEIRQTVDSNSQSRLHPAFRKTEQINLTLIEDLFLARCPDYYTTWQMRDEMDRLYGEITVSMPVLENPDDPSEVQFPSLGFEVTAAIIEKILKGKIGLTPLS